MEGNSSKDQGPGVEVFPLISPGNLPPTYGCVLLSPEYPTLCHKYEKMRIPEGLGGHGHLRNTGNKGRSSGILFGRELYSSGMKGKGEGGRKLGTRPRT